MTHRPASYWIHRARACERAHDYGTAWVLYRAAASTQPDQARANALRERANRAEERHHAVRRAQAQRRARAAFLASASPTEPQRCR